MTHVPPRAAGHHLGVSMIRVPENYEPSADHVCATTDREYRFILTFIVGASIVVSLIGRGEISDKVGRMPGAVDRVKELREGSEERLAEEENARVAQKKDAAASDDRGED